MNYVQITYYNEDTAKVEKLKLNCSIRSLKPLGKLYLYCILYLGNTVKYLFVFSLRGG